MFRTQVTYKDFNDKQHTEELYFHLLAPELVDLEFSTDFQGDGGMGDFIRETMKSGDGQKIYTFFKLMIVSSYGRRSADGSEFIKDPAFTKSFMQTRAYEEFFLWLVLDPKNAEKFWLGIMPERLAQQAEEMEKASTGKKSLAEMSKEELVALMQAKLQEKAPANEAVEA